MNTLADLTEEVISINGWELTKSEVALQLLKVKLQPIYMEIPEEDY